MTEPDVIVPLPNGDRLVYRDATHAYYLCRDKDEDGKLKRLVSVTTVLNVLDKSGPLMKWVRDVTLEGLNYWEVRDAAATRGTSVHDAAERLGNGEAPNVGDFPEEDRGYVQALAAWWMEYGPEVIAQEVMICDPILEYAGRLDLICKVGDETWLVDFKTSSGIYMTHHLQLAGYHAALEGWADYPKVDCLKIVRLGRDGIVEMVEGQADVAQWETVLAAYRMKTDLERDIRREEKRVLKEAA